MFKYYKKKPVVVRVIQLTRENLTWTATWCNGVPIVVAHDDAGEMYVGIDIKTLEGTMRAEIGDYIIMGVADEFYPCKPDIFERTYERLSVP